MKALNVSVGVEGHLAEGRLECDVAHDGAYIGAAVANVIDVCVGIAVWIGEAVAPTSLLVSCKRTWGRGG